MSGKKCTTRRQPVRRTRHTGVQVLATTRQRVLKLAEKVASSENKMWDTLVPELDKVDLMALVVWSEQFPDIKDTTKFDHSQFLTTTAGRVGLISSAIKAKMGVSVPGYLVLEYLVPQVEKVNTS